MPTENIILTVGNSMMGDDGAGPLLADLLHSAPVAGWKAIDGGSAPENVSHQIIELAPQRVVVFDAAEMGLAPGEIRRIDDSTIADMFIMTTHNLPLSFLIERLREHVADVLFVGIEPATVAFYYPMSDLVRDAVGQLHARLKSGTDFVHYPWLAADR